MRGVSSAAPYAALSAASSTSSGRTAHLRIVMLATAGGITQTHGSASRKMAATATMMVVMPPRINTSRQQRGSFIAYSTAFHVKSCQKGTASRSAAWRNGLYL